MADGRENVPMHPVPMSNLGSRKQDRPYQVDAHTTETQKDLPLCQIMDTPLKSQHWQ